MKQLFQFRNLGKRFVLPIIALNSFLATTAQPFLRSTIESKKIDLIETFNEIEVRGNDIKIILTDNLDGQLVFQGNSKDVKVAKATVINGKLIIDASRKKNYTEFKVYMSTANVRSLVTFGKMEILSSGTIKTRDLKLILNGSSLVSINHDGNLKIVPGSGYEFANNRN